MVMSLIKRIFGRGETKSAAELVYRKIMQQARKPIFFGDGKFPDSYDGRVEVLSVHLAVLMVALKNTDSADQKGDSFSQSVFDVMVSDFDIALREEGLTDSGVKRRIKPMIAYFYGRLRDVSNAMTDGEALSEVLQSGSLGAENKDFSRKMATYLADFNSELKLTGSPAVSQGNFEFPNI